MFRTISTTDYWTYNVQVFWEEVDIQNIELLDIPLTPQKTILKYNTIYS